MFSHCWTSFSAGQAVPLFAAATATVRVRVLLTVPHLCALALNVHVSVHALQADTLQFTGQGSVPHASSCLSSGHTLPVVICSAVTVRSRTLRPPPQVALQAPHGPHSPTLQSCGAGQFAATQPSQEGLPPLAMYCLQHSVQTLHRFAGLHS